MKHLNVLLVVVMGVVGTRQTQAQEATLHFMRALPQVTYNNPAIQPRYKFSLGLPGSSVYIQALNSGFSYNSFVRQQGDSAVADLSKLYKALGKKNYTQAAAQADLFRFSMKVNARMYFTWNITAKSYNRVMLPKGIYGLLIDGTGNMVNGTTNISPQAEGIAYVESGWGASYIVNRKLTVGAKVKLLKGIANITTRRAAINLNIDQDYGINMVADVDVQTSGLYQLDDDDFDPVDDWEVYKKNTGFAFDLGATYKLMDDRLTVGASLIDLGFINWKNNTYSYTINPAKANYTFRGVDLESLLNGEDALLDSETDKLDSLFAWDEAPAPSYRAPLPAKMYLSGSYALRKNLTLNALLFAERFRHRFAPGFSASVNKDFGRRLSASLSYTITNRSYNNIGAGMSFNFAPLQLYIVGDNLLGAPLALLTQGELNNYINNTRYFNLRAGLNFVFGWDKTQEKLPQLSRKKAE